MNAVNGRPNRCIVLMVLLGPILWTPQDTLACSTILVGIEATADGSVLLSSSCDGDIRGSIYVMPARNYAPGTKLPMYWNLPRPKNSGSGKGARPLYR